MDTTSNPPEVLPPQTATPALSGSIAEATIRLKPYQFKPGHSGNPGGEQKKLPITTALRRELEKEVPNAGGKTLAEMLAKRLIKLAVEGQGRTALEALTVIIDRTEGKVPIRSELTGANGAPVQFEGVANRGEVEQRISLLLIRVEQRVSGGSEEAK